MGTRNLAEYKHKIRAENIDDPSDVLNDLLDEADKDEPVFVVLCDEYWIVEVYFNNDARRAAFEQAFDNTETKAEYSQP